MCKGEQRGLGEETRLPSCAPALPNAGSLCALLLLAHTPSLSDVGIQVTVDVGYGWFPLLWMCCRHCSETPPCLSHFSCRDNPWIRMEQSTCWYGESFCMLHSAPSDTQAPWQRKPGGRDDILLLQLSMKVSVITGWH